MTTEPRAEAMHAARVCLRRGRVLSSEGAVDARLETLAAAAAELLAAEANTDFASLFASLDGKERVGSLHELVLISEGHVHVVQRARHQLDEALVAVVPMSPALGLLLSNVRASFARLQEAP